MAPLIAAVAAAAGAAATKKGKLRTMKKLPSIFSQLVLLLMLVFTSIAPVSAKVASGLQALGGGLSQGQTPVEALLHLGSSDISTIDASGSPLVPKGTPSIKQQAQELKHKLNGDKNTVTVRSGNKETHFDLDGPPHKGVDTPHKQFSHPNTNPQGQTFFNKDRKTVGSMTQQDIRTVRNILERRNRQ